MESRERRTTGCLLFDWGNTLMRDFPQCRGPMMAWPTVEVIPGVVEALQAVRPQWQTALATNAVDSDEPCIWAALRRGGLRDLIDRVYCFRRVGHKKPSPQFYKQIMVGSGLERVFEIGHAYRAEKSETARHLTEYVSLDFEMGFIDSEQDVMRAHAGLIGAIFRTVRDKCHGVLERHGVELPEVTEIPQVSFPEAKRIVQEKSGKTHGLDGDLDTEGERLICQWAREELGSELVFVTGYHVENRPMYTMPKLNEPPLTRSFDLLFRGVEVTTGGQRIHDYQQLVESIRSRGLNPDDYEGYLEAFKHGMCPHGGMGMGIERLLMQMLGLGTIKEACLFPRDRYRLTP